MIAKFFLAVKITYNGRKIFGFTRLLHPFKRESASEYNPGAPLYLIRYFPFAADRQFINKSDFNLSFVNDFARSYGFENVEVFVENHEIRVFADFDTAFRFR